jgi:NADPH:quinone reductase-like Zn-dependent oxidoreductase
LQSELESLGSSLTISYEDANPEAILKSLNSFPILALTSVGGSYFNKILAIMNENSIIYSIGSLNKKPFEISFQDLVFRDITLKGFWISQWYQKNNFIFKERLKMLNEILDLYYTGDLKLPEHKYLSMKEMKIEAFRNSNAGIKTIFIP